MRRPAAGRGAERRPVDRLFLDANVLFSAAFRPDAGIARLWRLREVELISSSYAVEEARLNLETEVQHRRLESLLAPLRILTSVTVGTLPPGVELPEKDQPILLAAMQARATHLLTGDRRHFGKYFNRRAGGILILPPEEYPLPI